MAFKKSVVYELYYIALFLTHLFTKRGSHVGSGNDKHFYRHRHALIFKVDGKVGSTIEYCFGTDSKTVLYEKIISPEMEYETSDLWNERFGT